MYSLKKNRVKFRLFIALADRNSIGGSKPLSLLGNIKNLPCADRRFKIVCQQICKEDLKKNRQDILHLKNNLQFFFKYQILYYTPYDNRKMGYASIENIVSLM